MNFVAKLIVSYYILCALLKFEISSGFNLVIEVLITNGKAKVKYSFRYSTQRRNSGLTTGNSFESSRKKLDGVGLQNISN